MVRIWLNVGYENRREKRRHEFGWFEWKGIIKEYLTSMPSLGYDIPDYFYFLTHCLVSIQDIKRFTLSLMDRVRHLATSFARWV